MRSPAVGGTGVTVLLIAAGVVAYLAVGLGVGKLMDRHGQDDGDSPEPWDPAALACVVALWPAVVVLAAVVALACGLGWLAGKAGRLLARVAQVEVRR